MLLRYYRCFSLDTISVNNIFSADLLRYYVITLLRVLSFDTIFSVDMLRYYALTSALISVDLFHFFKFLSGDIIF